MSEPLVTDEDREKAAKLLWGTTAASRARTEAVAAALAAEREKARAPFLALAEQLEDEATDGALPWDTLAAKEDAADRIRAAWL